MNTLTSSAFSNPRPLYKAQPQEANPWTNNALGYGLEILYDDNFNQNYDKDNKAVVAATKGANTFSWRGPIFAHCGQRRGDQVHKSDIVDVRDMSMLGYAHVVANLMDYYNNDHRHARRKGPKVFCVKVACNSDRLSPNTTTPPIRPGHTLASHL